MKSYPAIIVALLLTLHSLAAAEPSGVLIEQFLETASQALAIPNVTVALLEGLPPSVVYKLPAKAKKQVPIRSWEYFVIDLNGQVMKVQRSTEKTMPPGKLLYVTGFQPMLLSRNIEVPEASDPPLRKAGFGQNRRQWIAFLVPFDLAELHAAMRSGVTALQRNGGLARTSWYKIVDGKAAFEVARSKSEESNDSLLPQGTFDDLRVVFAETRGVKAMTEERREALKLKLKTPAVRALVTETGKAQSQISGGQVLTLQMQLLLIPS